MKTFKNGDVFTPVLKGIDFVASQGEWVAIMGRSGAGKSTFLYQMSLLDDPTSGEIVIDGHDTHEMSANEKMQFRLSKFGFVFQRAKSAFCGRTDCKPRQRILEAHHGNIH
ncbi:ATP-binding cassette domain-containing protein [Candidatus Kaiserbacteria bacterium]|nr:ATP-binding cassette domain-containing protein [Candidatus Kaiserbacteria bacterium]